MSALSPLREAYFHASSVSESPNTLCDIALLRASESLPRPTDLAYAQPGPVLTSLEGW